MSISLIVCIAGGLAYLIFSLYQISNGNVTWPQLAELGRLAFFAGLLAYLLGK